MNSIWEKFLKKIKEARYKVVSLSLITLAIVLYANACTQNLNHSGNSKGTSGINDGGELGSDGSGGGSEAEIYDNESLNYAEDIAPLVMKNCTPCHSRGESIAPFPLETHEDFVDHANLSLQAMQERTMPPSGLDASGACNEFEEDTWYLTDAQIQMIGQWIDEGMYKGDPRKIPAVPEIGVAIPNPDVVVRMPEPYTPNPLLGGIDDYQCFIVDPGNTEDVYLTGVEVRPGDARVVHHVIMFQPSNILAQGAAELKDLASPGPGYPCFGGAGAASQIVALWAPGTQGDAQMVDPSTGEELGLKLYAGRKLIIQMHYNIELGQFPDQTEIALKYTKDPSKSKEVKWLMISNFALLIPPGLESISTIMIPQDLALTKWLDTVYHGLSDLNLLPLVIAESIVATFTNPPPIPQDMTIYAVGPHMHNMGRTIKVEKTNAFFGLGENGVQCLLDVPQFDFNWQMGYYYKEPIEMSAFDRLSVNCSFDSRGRVLPALFGENTNDEMCLAFLLVHEKPLFGDLFPVTNSIAPNLPSTSLIDPRFASQENFPGTPNLPSQELIDYILSNDTRREK